MGISNSSSYPYDPRPCMVRHSNILRRTLPRCDFPMYLRPSLDQHPKQFTRLLRYHYPGNGRILHLLAIPIHHMFLPPSPNSLALHRKSCDHASRVLRSLHMGTRPLWWSRLLRPHKDRIHFLTSRLDFYGGHQRLHQW